MAKNACSRARHGTLVTDVLGLPDHVHVGPPRMWVPAPRSSRNGKKRGSIKSGARLVEDKCWHWATKPECWTTTAPAILRWRAKKHTWGSAEQVKNVETVPRQLVIISSHSINKKLNFERVWWWRHLTKPHKKSQSHIQPDQKHAIKLFPYWNQLRGGVGAKWSNRVNYLEGWHSLIVHFFKFHKMGELLCKWWNQMVVAHPQSHAWHRGRYFHSS